MDTSNPFKWRHFQAEMILLCVRWYLRYPLSYRDLEETMLERGLRSDRTTIYLWVQHYAPELEQRCQPHLKAANDSWRVDETYIKVKKVWMYLYRAVDSQGNALEFLLSSSRDSQAAKRFFAKALAAPHIGPPRVITVDKNTSYPQAFKELRAEGILPDVCELRQSKYLNSDFATQPLSTQLYYQQRFWDVKMINPADNTAILAKTQPKRRVIDAVDSSLLSKTVPVIQLCRTYPLCG